MYISPRTATVRNLLVSVANGSITLVILLIAPLGLAAVIINTLLVTVATYVVTIIADWVMVWLQPSSQAELLSESTSRRGSISRHRQQDSVERWRRRQ
jgi:hypothetical protein